jgi:phosphate transport system permease protein
VREGVTHTARRTSRAVYLWDKGAGAVITIGGVAVLAAVLGICVYLVWTVVPLFKPGRLTPDASQSAKVAGSPVATALGEYDQAALFIDASGGVEAMSLKSGDGFFVDQVAPGLTITAASRPEREGLLAIATSDGGVRIGTVVMSSRLLREDELTDQIRAIPVGGEISQKGGASETQPGRLIEHTRADQFRVSTAELKLREAANVKGSVPIARIDLRESSTGGRFLVTLRADGAGAFGTVRTTTPLGGGEPKERVTSTPFTLAGARTDSPDWLFVTSDGKHILAVWRDGALDRYQTATAEEGGVRLAESTTVAPSGAKITAAAMLLGGQTLIVGDSSGQVRGYDVARDVTSPAPDAMRLVESSSFAAGAGPVSALVMGERDRIAGAACAGEITLRHMTSRKVIARAVTRRDVSSLAMAPRGDGLLAMGEDGHYQTWDLSLGHADAGIASLFAPLMYEGESRPRFIYQSSSGSDASEIKLSLVPLIFGTLKATLVGMLVAVPLAVLGAIYSSEFMHRNLRKVVKPTVELMASLPSVVLGFVAAMVVAPFLRDWLARFLVGVVLTPVFLALSAYLWQLVPRDAAAKVTRRARMALVGTALGLSIVVATALGPAVERTLFQPTHQDELVAAESYKAVPNEQWPSWVGQRQTMSPDEERSLRREGLYFRSGQVVQPIEANVAPTAAGPASIQRWLDGSIGDAQPGWILALFLPVLLIVWLIQARLVDRERFEIILGATRGAMAAAELMRLLGVVAVGVGATVGLAWLFTRIGWDPRDSIFGPFSQRNSLVVGVMMGFAVIPIVYTISEDALRSVPNSLRSASLGVGATPWQTAVRVVLPAAGSGVFSAIMIGLGRAVGETMIVLMAAGNTPEISANIFSGFRTLAANIAVELPEAVRHSTHYRVLFLCGLVLFAMTFAINTTAEIVRQRFRKRNAAL